LLPASQSKASRAYTAGRGKARAAENYCQPHSGGSAGSLNRSCTKSGQSGGSSCGAPKCTCGGCKVGAEDGPEELQDLIASLDQMDPSDRRMIAQVEGSVWALATSKDGSRLLQEIFESGDSQGKARLAAELKGNVNRAWQCEVAARYANFVIQKCVEVMPPGLCHFVRDEMMGANVEEAACSKYGCRILQRLIEHFHNREMEDLLKVLLEERTLWGLMANKYGNFVVQCVLEHGSKPQRSLIAQVVLGHTEQRPEDELRLAEKAKKMPEGLGRDYRRVAALASSMYASNVMQKAMMHCSEDEQRQIVRKVLDAERLPFLKRSRYGSFVTSEAQKLHDRIHSEA